MWKRVVKASQKTPTRRLSCCRLSVHSLAQAVVPCGLSCLGAADVPTYVCWWVCGARVCVYLTIFPAWRLEHCAGLCGSPLCPTVLHLAGLCVLMWVKEGAQVEQPCCRASTQDDQAPCVYCVYGICRTETCALNQTYGEAQEQGCAITDVLCSSRVV